MTGIGGGDVRVVSVNLESGALSSSPESLVRLVADSRTPDWSPDGRSLAYLSSRDGRLVIVIHETETREFRELPLSLDYLGVLRWAPDGRSFVGKGNVRGREGVYQIDARTGAATVLALSGNTGLSMAQLSRDGRKVYYWDGDAMRGTAGSRFVERDLPTGVDRMVFAGPGPAFPELSPDGRYLAGTWRDEGTKTSEVILVSVADGQRRVLLRVPDSERFDAWGYTSWTPDGRHVAVPHHAGSVHDALLVPIEGGAPRTLAIDTRT